MPRWWQPEEPRSRSGQSTDFPACQSLNLWRSVKRRARRHRRRAVGGGVGVGWAWRTRALRADGPCPIVQSLPRDSPDSADHASPAPSQPQLLTRDQSCCPATGEWPRRGPVGWLIASRIWKGSSTALQGNGKWRVVHQNRARRRDESTMCILARLSYRVNRAGQCQHCRGAPLWVEIQPMLDVPTLATPRGCSRRHRSRWPTYRHGHR